MPDISDNSLEQDRMELAVLPVLGLDVQFMVSAMAHNGAKAVDAQRKMAATVFARHTKCEVWVGVVDHQLPCHGHR